jgi:hypothetical protein
MQLFLPHRPSWRVPEPKGDSGLRNLDRHERLPPTVVIGYAFQRQSVAPNDRESFLLEKRRRRGPDQDLLATAMEKD